MRNGTTAHRSVSDDAGVRDSDDLEFLPRRIAEVTESVRRNAIERPARTLALAAGAGYVVGGGLFSPLSARLVATGLRVGLRVALLPFVTKQLAALAEVLLSGTSSAVEVGVSSGGEAPSSKTGSRSGAGTTGRASNNKETHS